MTPAPYTFKAIIINNKSRHAYSFILIISPDVVIN